MFAALALGLGLPHTALSVRHDIVNFIKNHKEEVLYVSHCTRDVQNIAFILVRFLFGF